MTGGAIERTVLKRSADGFPLFWRDVADERVVQRVEEIDGLVEVSFGGDECGQRVELEGMASLDAIEGGAGGFKSRAAELIDGRTDSIGDWSEADANAQRKWLEEDAKVQKDAGNSHRFGRDGLELIAGGDSIGKQDELFAKVLFGGFGKDLR